MAATQNWSHRVYFKSQIEHDLISARATSLGKKVSTYLRDLAIVDLNVHGVAQRTDWRPDVTRVESPPAITEETKLPPHVSQFPDRLFKEGELQAEIDADKNLGTLDDLKKTLGITDGGIDDENEA